MAKHRRPSRKNHRRYVQLFACLAIVCAGLVAWSLTIPPFGGVDESAHVAKAAAVVRGELVGRAVGGGNVAVAKVTIPGTFANGSGTPWCFIDDGTQKAACAPAVEVSNRPVSMKTYVARYPLPYYFLVGLPSLVSTSMVGYYGMREASVLLNSVFIALAAMAIVWWSKSRMMLIGLLVAITPETMYLASYTNPNGLGITACACFWVCGIIFVREYPTDPPPGLIAMAALSGATTCLVRQLSPFWMMLVLIVLVIMYPGMRRLKSVANRLGMRLAGLASFAAALATTVWVVYEHSLDLVLGLPTPSPRVSTWRILEKLVALNSTYAHMMVGSLGWKPVNVPLATFAVWSVAACLLVVGGIWLGNRRDCAGLIITGVLTFIVPIALTWSQVHRAGYSWGGRYTLPLAVGIPLLASEAIGIGIAGRNRRWLLGAMPIAAALLSGASVLAMVGELRRYAVGAQGAVEFLGRGWIPPFGDVVVLLLSAGSAVAVTIAVGRCASSERRASGRGEIAKDGDGGRVRRHALMGSH